MGNQYNNSFYAPTLKPKMASLVRKDIVEEVKNSDVPWFTLLEDGTRDKNNRENIAIALRYVKNGVVKESLLDIVTCTKLDAKTFTELTMQILKGNGIDSSRFLSQCYDGASVMSGKKNGVADRIEKELKREIPYVHCFNHRLHLVVITAIAEIAEVRHFFDQCIMIHEFFKHPKVSAIYEGRTIVRLLPQRWSGHLTMSEVIFSNFSEIIRVLNVIKKHREFNGEDTAKSAGILSVMLKLEFRFALVLCLKILRYLEPADACLQARETSLKEGLGIIKSVKVLVSEMKTDQCFKMILKEAENLILSNSEDFSERRKKVLKEMPDFIITTKLPAHSTAEPTNFNAVFCECIDVVLQQLNERFIENDELLNEIYSVSLISRNLKLLVG